jgi:hypothetical protein
VRFTQEQLEAALAEFTANAAVRVVPGAGYNKEIIVFTDKGEQNGSNEKPTD